MADRRHQISTQLQFALNAADAVRRERWAFVDRIGIRREATISSPPTRLLNRVCTVPSQRLHEWLNIATPCRSCERFVPDVWDPIQRRLLDAGHHGVARPKVRDAHDGDVSLATVLWALVTHLKPALVVETGVARGISSAVILAGLDSVDSGRLYSIDLPPLNPRWYGQSRMAVDERLWPRWTYIRGSARRKLAPTLARLGPVDLFVHDSLHTYEHMRFEFTTAAHYLSERGVIVADDIEDNQAFDELVDKSGQGRWLVARGAIKADDLFGVWQPMPRQPQNPE